MTFEIENHKKRKICFKSDVPMSSLNSTIYNMGFTASSLRPELSRIVAEYYIKAGNWKDTKINILAANALQSRSYTSSVRMEREFRRRLSTLTQEQINLLAKATSDDRAAIAWLAVCKDNTFIFDFAAEVLRDKLTSHDPVLRLSDYESFVELKSLSHPELLKLTSLSKNKIRQTLLRMLAEAGILTEGSGLGSIQRPLLSPLVKRAIVSDSPNWLKAFLVPETEIGSY